MIREVPKKYKTQYKKAMSGRSRREAMRAFCNECVGYVHTEVELCTDAGCPLYPYRLK
jgi:hypothetical protein